MNLNKAARETELDHLVSCLDNGGFRPEDWEVLMKRSGEAVKTLPADVIIMSLATRLARVSGTEFSYRYVISKETGQRLHAMVFSDGTQLVFPLQKSDE